MIQSDDTGDACGCGCLGLLAIFLVAWIFQAVWNWFAASYGGPIMPLWIACGVVILWLLAIASGQILRGIL